MVFRPRQRRQTLDLSIKINKNNIIRSDLEKHETRNMSDRNRCFGASCAIIKVT